jgi:xanthine dehydrogenase YagR molybdenum-binding subunit
MRRKLFRLAQGMGQSPFASAELSDMTCGDGRIRSLNDPSLTVSLTEVMGHGKPGAIEVEASVKPLREQDRSSRSAHSAVFAEVRVDEDFGTARVTRVVSEIAGGRILNPKAARSQILGAVVWGIAMALQEEGVIDHALGRFINHNLAD